MNNRWVRRPSGLWTPEGIYDPVRFLQGVPSRILGMLRTKAGVSSEAGAGTGVKAETGGPNVYYYGAGSDTYAQTHELEEQRAVGDDITIVATGSITKIGFKVSDKSSGNIKIMLLTTAGALHECQTVLNAAMTNGQWADVTLATPLAATANDIISVVIGVSASYSSVVYCNTSQNGLVDGTHDYSVFCGSAPTPGSYAGQAIAVRVYVD